MPWDDAGEAVLWYSVVLFSARSSASRFASHSIPSYHLELQWPWSVHEEALSCTFHDIKQLKVVRGLMSKVAIFWRSNVGSLLVWGGGVSPQAVRRIA